MKYFQAKIIRSLFYVLTFVVFNTTLFAQTKTVSFSTAGTYSITIPCDVTSITVQVWGAGGGGGFARSANGAAGGGGGGGAYASSIIAVTSGTTYPLVVGTGGIGGINNASPSQSGGVSSFNSTAVVAAGGLAGGNATTNAASAPGLGGTVAASVGTTRFSGGQGATGIAGTSPAAGGGGGGGSAGIASAGNYLSPAITLTGGAAVAGGGAGGNGSRDANGLAGLAPGGGGGGGSRVGAGNQQGGNGADGRVVITFNSAFNPYCASIPLNTGLNDGISQVLLNTINNTSTTNAGTEYQDFSCSINTNLERGLTYPFSVYTNTGGNLTRTQRAWIDWNQNGSFNDAGEQYNFGSITNVTNGVSTVSITVPATAVLGSTKMRITSSSLANPNSCDNQNFSGQVEDYRITVLAATNCSGSPTAGAITISATTGAPSSTFTLTATGYTVGTGISYQWQSGPSATGPWTNIGGATNVPAQTITASATPGNTTFYQLLVRCTASAQNSASNAVSFTTSNSTSSISTTGGTTTIACGTNITLYDNGGPGSNYANGADGYIYLQNSGTSVITITGSYDINTAGTGDFLTIYNSTGSYINVNQTWYSTTNPVANAYNGTGTVNFTSAPGQPLTIRFNSNNSQNAAGFVLNVSYSGNCGAATYCTPPNMGLSGYLYFLTNVKFVGTLNDVSNTSSYSNNGYQDFTNLTQAVQEAGEGVNVKYAINDFRGQIKAWIDWNKNNTFDEPAETVYDPGNIVTQTGTFGFVIPSSTAPGVYRLRIRTVNNFDVGTAATGPYPSGTYVTLTPCGRLFNGETEDYHFTVIPRCNARITGYTGQAKCTNIAQSFTLTATGSAGVTGINWYATETGGAPLAGSTFIASPPTGTFTTPPINTTTTYWVAAVDATCETPVRVPVIAEVKSIPDVSFTPASPNLCEGAALSVTGGTSTPELVDLINEGFEAGGTGVFTVSTPAATPIDSIARMAWQNKTSTYISSNTTTWRPAISSGFGANKFVFATSDFGNGSLDTRLISPQLNTTNFTNLTLSFRVYFSHYLADDSVNITDYFVPYTSTDGTNYTAIPAHLAANNHIRDLGEGTRFQTITYDMSSFVGNANFRILFRYLADWVDGVALDSIKLFGQRPPTSNFTWQQLDAVTLAPVLPINNLYTSLSPATLYVAGNAAPNVFVQPTASQQTAGLPLPFIASLNLSNGCTIKDTIRVFIDNKIWIGNTPDWNVASNWCGNVLPTLNDRVRIPTAPSGGNMPVIFSGNTGNVRSLVVEPGASTTINTGGNLNIQLDLNTNTGASFVNNGTLSLLGNEPGVSQNFPGPGTIAQMNNLTINNTTASPPGGNHVILNAPISIRGELRPTAGKLYLGNNDVTLKSLVNATAFVSAVTGTAGFTYGTGRFVVERFIKTPRKWQFLSVPTNSTQTVNQAWQEGQVPGTTVDVGGYGTQISTQLANPTSFGFDFTSTVGPGMKFWDVATQNYLPQPNTSSPIASNKGYFLFVRGNRAQVGLAGSSTTTLRTRGQLFTGNQAAIAVPANQFVSIGNPYASSLNMNNIPLTGMTQSFYVWDPKLTGTYGDGAFQTFTKVGANWVPSPGGGSFDVVSGSTVYDSSFIPSGHAFFVRGGAGASSISFDEGDKAPDTHNASRTQGPPVGIIHAGLYVAAPNDQMELIDGAMVTYSKTQNDGLDAFDAPKLLNASQNISIRSGGYIFSVEQRRDLKTADTIFINMAGMRVRSYVWNIKCMDIKGQNIEAWLVDQYLNIRTEINLSSENNRYAFDVINAAGSYASDRFMIVFKRTAPKNQPNQLPVNPPMVKNAFFIYPNPVTDNFVNVQISTNDKGRYSWQLKDVNGKQVGSGAVNLVNKQQLITISIDQMLANGSYELIINKQGSSTFAQWIVIQR